MMNTWQKKMNRTEMLMKITVVIRMLITLTEMLAQAMALQDSQDLTGEVVDDVVPAEGQPHSRGCLNYRVGDTSCLGANSHGHVGGLTQDDGVP
ncbi:unnamed protein product [Rangifer tarandus platyrhynchus]|uniref:Uncharacterized protein n=2 Tax=Rangifer tarandus platyrhynchus TaxID=3082113 RepID=A0ACB0ECR1_RANTA|nr:unnamed protein product [Rangifer tarandus platyrhynchus]CAI9698380.1 unnamed protein product [Rangifer tarandus platyrhynchus]